MTPQPVQSRAVENQSHPEIIERVIDCLRERFVVIDHTYKILIVNDAALPNGSSKEDVLGRGIFDAYPNLLSQGFKKIIDDVFATGNPHIEFYVRHTTVDGYTGFHHRKIIPLKNVDGFVEGVTVIVENVHEERVAQLQSRHTEFEYMQLIETLHLVSFELNASGTIVQINKAVKPVLGFNQGDLLGKSFTRCIHPDDIRKTWHIYWQIVNLGKPFGVCDNRFMAADGSYVHMRWSIHPLFDENGAIIGCRGVGENMSEDHARLEDLKDQLRLVEETLQAAPAPVMVVRDGVVIKINRALFRMLHVNTRGKLPGLKEIGQQLRCETLESLFTTAHTAGTARLAAKIVDRGVERDMVVTAIRIHNAVVIAFEVAHAVQ